MNNLIDLLKEQLDKVANYNLAVFGICFTVFTVLYAFISSKKDTLIQLNEEIKVTANNLVTLKRFKLIQVLIAKWKRINYAIILLGTCFLIQYLVSIAGITFVNSAKILMVIKNFLICTSTCITIVALFFLVKFIRNYFKEVNSI